MAARPLPVVSIRRARDHRRGMNRSRQNNNAWKSFGFRMNGDRSEQSGSNAFNEWTEWLRRQDSNLRPID